MTNLFDVTRGLPSLSDKPRSATDTERTAYLRWLASHRGVDVEGCDINADGIWRGRGKDAECVLEMPGYGAQSAPYMETLDEAGNVVRKMPLATDARGRLVLSAKQIQEAAGLKPAKKARKAAVAPVERVAMPVAVKPPAASVAAVIAPTASTATPAADMALGERVAALEATLQRMGLAIGGVTAPRRTDAERRAIVRAWRMRCDMRSRADLDRRALLKANGDNRLLHTTLQQAERSRDALVVRSDDMRDQRDAASARAIDMERIAKAHEATAAAMEQRADDEAARAVAAERKLWSVEQHAAGAERRVARMVRAASDYRKTARRAAEDVRGARAEARALARRLEDAQRAAAAFTARHAPPPPSDTVMARAFATAAR